MGEMVKTTDELCKGCKYSLVNIGGTSRYCCDYISKTGQSRRCPVGMCDKYEKNIGRRKSFY